MEDLYEGRDDSFVMGMAAYVHLSPPPMQSDIVLSAAEVA